MNEFAKLAQDFVEATSLLVGQRTINIMDQKGVIIASTEKHRIGDFHQGAAEVLETGKPVLIKKEDLYRYPGTKEGYNMPIFLNDRIIGVVGIFGCEEEVQSIANLLRVYVTQSFSQLQMTQKQNLEAELRNQLLRLLLFGGSSQKEMIENLCGMLNLQLDFPIRVILLHESAIGRHMKHLQDYSQLIQNLIWKNILDRKRDVFGIQNEDYVILLAGNYDRQEMHKRLERLLDEIKAEDAWNVTVSSPCRTIKEVSDGMREVSMLKKRKIPAKCSICLEICSCRKVEEPQKKCLKNWKSSMEPIRRSSCFTLHRRIMSAREALQRRQKSCMYIRIHCCIV